MSPNIEELIQRCKQNDREAQATLYELYKNQLFSLSLKYCRNFSDAEDNLQDSFISIFTKINNYKSSGSFEGWMKRITINKAIDKYRKTGQVDSELNENMSVATSLSKEEITSINHYSLDQILAMIQDLPDRYRLVFNLYELDGFSHKEIAKLLGISEGTSKSNYHRAKKILKEKIKTTQLTPKAI